MPVPKRFSAAKFAAAWNVSTDRGGDIAARFGMARSTANRAALAMGLPHKKRGRRPKFDEAVFAAMWRDGVRGTDIQHALGICEGTVTNAVNRMGLPKRGRGPRPAMTVAQHRATQARAMASTAAQERAAMIKAEMADGTGNGGQLVGQKHARAI